MQLAPLSSEEAAKPYRLRIPPAHPRDTHTFISTGRVFDKKRRWYGITAEEKERYSKVPLYDTNPASPPLFEIVTPDVAREIDIRENVVGAAVDAAAAERETKLRAELDELSRKLAAADQRAVEADARSARIEAMLGQLIAGQRQASAPVEAEEKVETKVEAKTETKVEAKPARPGERRDGNKKPPKPETKEEKTEAKVDADPADATPADAYDASLKAEGFTPNR